MEGPILVTISFSHYCEKARWALDRVGIAYREETYVPATHIFGTLRRGGRSTPMLARPDQKPLTDSTDILRYADRARPGTFFPIDPSERGEVEALEELFDEELGPHSRRVAYHALLTSGASFAPVVRATTAGLQRRLAPLIGLLAPLVVKRALRVDAAGAALSRERVERVLERVETLLADGRSYLVGDRFTAADLTFASLMGPLTNPPEHPVTSKIAQTDSYKAMCATYASRPAGAFVLRMYATERTHRAS